MAETRKAGLNLDEEIAQRVMGWKPYISKRSGTWIAPGGYHASRDSWPSYSTDIAAAWEVVEKLSGFVDARAEPWWSVAVFNCQKNQVGCRVYACHPGQSLFDVEARAIIAETVGDSAAHAICLAALAATPETPHVG
jgi:hypothetical protein